MKNVPSFFAVFFFVLSAGAGAGAPPAWEETIRSEFASRLLMQDAGLDVVGRATLVRQKWIDSRDGMDEVQVLLTHEKAGTVRLLLKGPRGFLESRKHALGSLLLVSGFFTGQESVRLLPGFRNQVIVGFEYPVSLDQISRQPAEILRFIRQTPAQIALALRWLAEQPWQSETNLNAMGVSLGGIFLPAGLHLAQKLGVFVPHSIFVCTGADLTAMLENNLRQALIPEIREPLILQLNNAMTLDDPKIHLPFLLGSFLTIRSDGDTVIPESATVRLHELLPDGAKSWAVVHGPHINSDQQDLIRQIEDVTLQWLGLEP